MQAEYSPQRVSKLAEKNLTEWVSRMYDSELREYSYWIPVLQVLLKDTLNLIEQKKINRRRLKK